MKIGILQTGHTPDVVLNEMGDYAQMFERLLDGHGFSFQRYTVIDGVFPDKVSDADGWLITGSKHGAYENLPWIPPLEDFIREISRDGRPLIGICFGHQIIAQALGGKVEKFPQGWAIGAQEYDFSNGESLTLNAWHQDQVTELPEGAKVVASNDFCEYAGLVIGNNILTIQPHPEFGATMLERLVTHRGRGNVPDDLLDKALANLDHPTDSHTYAGQMAAFFQRSRA